MATTRRRQASSTRRRGNPQTPGWVWALAGLIIGLFVALLVWLWKSQDKLPAIEQPVTVKETAAPPPQPVIVVPEKPTAAATTARVENKKPDKPGLEFYNMLPKQTVDAPTDDYRSAGPGPLLQPSQPSQAQTEDRFFLQAGSFRKQRDADKRRAQLALIGVESRIERVQVNDGFWHRVRLGPFTSLDAANQLRTRLHSEKIQTMLVNAGN